MMTAKTRATDAVRASEVPINSGPARASQFVPKGGVLFLKDIEGIEVLIYNISPEKDDFGPCADLVIVCEGEEEPVMVRASGFLGGKLIGLRERVDAGECGYPLAAKFSKVQIKGGKTCWVMV